MNAAFSNALYTFGNKIHRQREGAAIGDVISGDISDLIMEEWDKEVAVIIKDNNIKVELEFNYVDDVRRALKAISRGYTFN